MQHMKQKGFMKHENYLRNHTERKHATDVKEAEVFRFSRRPILPMAGPQKTNFYLSNKSPKREHHLSNLCGPRVGFYCKTAFRIKNIAAWFQNTTPIASLWPIQPVTNNFMMFLRLFSDSFDYLILSKITNTALVIDYSH